MGSVPAELSLQIRTPEAAPPPPPPPSARSFIPKTITDFISGLSTSEITASEKQSTINDFLSHLEDEYNKIHAFKRELPLSMLLLGDAIVELKEQLAKCSEGSCKSHQPVLEEFIPLKKEFDHSEDDEEHVNNDNNNNNNRKEKECRDKKSWLSSVQLWNTSSSISLNNNNSNSNNNNNNNNNAFDNNHKHHHQNHHHHKFGIKKNQECVVEDPFQSRSNVRNNGGRGFMPFTSYSSCSVPVTTVALSASKEEKEDIGAINRLPLLTPAAGVGGVKTLREGSGSSGSRTSSNNRPVSSSSPPAAAVHRTAMLPLQPQQTARKQRRCWSPELHRRFVNALQKLGGSQVATPKQIRELMQVDGLTNDEVKSHLQKYRLHTRRVPSGSGNHNHNHNQSVVVLGGLWMSQGQDRCNDSSKGSSSGSGSPQSPLHLATGSRGGMSPTEGDDSMEDDEDEKSESYSWKSHTHHKQVKVVDV